MYVLLHVFTSSSCFKTLIENSNRKIFAISQLTSQIKKKKKNQQSIIIPTSFLSFKIQH